MNRIVHISYIFVVWVLGGSCIVQKGRGRLTKMLSPRDFIMRLLVLVKFQCVC